MSHVATSAGETVLVHAGRYTIAELLRRARKFGEDPRETDAQLARIAERERVFDARDRELWAAAWAAHNEPTGIPWARSG